MKKLVQDLIVWRSERIKNSDEALLNHINNFKFGGRQVNSYSEFSVFRLHLFSTLTCLLLILTILILQYTTWARDDRPILESTIPATPIAVVVQTNNSQQSNRDDAGAFTINLNVKLDNKTECVEIKQENGTRWIRC